jgi:O-antigen ligase
VPAVLFLGLSLISGVAPSIELAKTLRGDSVDETFLSLAMATFSGGNNPLSLSWHHLMAVFLLFLVAGRSARATAAGWLQKTAILTTAFLGLVTVAEWILETQIGYPTLSGLIGAKFPPGRPPGTFSWPTQLATYLNLTLPLTLAWVWLGRWREERGTWADWVAPLASLLGTIALFLSGSRGGWAGLLLSVLLLFILVARSGLSRRRLIFGAVLAVLVYVPLTGLLIGARHQAGEPGSEVGTQDAATRGAVTQEAMRLEGSGPYRGRLGYTWPAALAMIRTHPVFGIGLGTWREVSLDFAPPAARDLVLEKATERAHAHSILLHTAAERGIPASVALLGLLIVLTVLLFRRASSGGRAAPAWLGLAAALPGFLVHGMLDEVLYHPQFFFCFWSLVGLIGARCGQRGAP